VTIGKGKWMRDIDVLEKRELVMRNGKTVRANKALIAQFLPIRANCPTEILEPISETSISSAAFRAIARLYDTSDFSKGGELRCPVAGCSCCRSLDFDFKNAP
jgi:hypothetical protein